MQTSSSLENSAFVLCLLYLPILGLIFNRNLHENWNILPTGNSSISIPDLCINT